MGLNGELTALSEEAEKTRASEIIENFILNAGFYFPLLLIIQLSNAVRLINFESFLRIIPGRWNSFPNRD